MNPADHHSPEPADLADTIDEALSASIDGEVTLTGDLREALALAIGVEPGVLPSTDVLERRREALRATGAAFAVEPLDELTRERLLRAALVDTTSGPDQRSRTQQRRLGVLGLAAAALLVVVGVVAIRSGSDPEDSGTTNVAASGADTGLSQGATAPTGEAALTADLGDVTSTRALAAAVRARLGADDAVPEAATTTVAPPAGTNVPDVAPPATSAHDAGATEFGTGSGDHPPTEVAPRATTSADASAATAGDALACLPEPVQASGPTVLGTARYEGRSVVVIASTPADATPGNATVVARVIDPQSCEVLVRRTVTLG